MKIRRLALLLAVAAFPFTLPACAEKATLPLAAGEGPNPTLPAPVKSLVPTVNTATAVGWPAGGKPVAADGFTVAAYATGFDHPRWLYTLPNGDVLVAETDAPPKPKDSAGVKGQVMKLVMKNAGSGERPSANRITLLRSSKQDGVADVKTPFIEGLHSPFGMALVGNDLYVADTDALLRFPYKTGATHISDPGTVVTELPGGIINHHWTKNVIASPDGKTLYVTIGSNSNVGDNGIAAEEGRARIIAVDPKTGRSRPFATGLRNPNGMGWQPQSHALWVAVNERDELGSDLVPDYMTSVKDGGFYGWPYSYYGQHVDDRVKPQRPDLVASAIVPDYALGPHTASLGLAFYTGTLFPAHYRDGAFIGQHGSWNRDPRSGYDVVFVPFTNGVPSGKPEDFVTGFLNQDGKAQGRPVGIAVAKDGALLVADDVGNTVWRVTPAAK